MTFYRLSIRLLFAALVSAFWSLVSLAVLAHEVTPTIGDLDVTDGALTLVLRLNAEAYMAGIDLDGIDDTDETVQSGDYDSLRAMPSKALKDRLDSFVPVWAQGIVIEVNGAQVPLKLVATKVDPLGDVDLPRTSHVTLAGLVASSASELTLGWPRGAGALVLRQIGVEDPFTGIIEGGATSPVIALAGGDQLGGWATFVSYIPIGFDHILPKGLDHILFVLGLFFLSTRLGPLLWQISAFTLAHTVTLALGALGWVSVPASIVEPLIAASITYVAVENLFTNKLSRWRPIVIFCFGLLHGLGFASVLEEYGLPEAQFFPALVGFNVGVEFGQLTVIAIAFALAGVWFRNKPWYRARIAVPASVLIALVGAYWFVERVFF